MNPVLRSLLFLTFIISVRSQLCPTGQLLCGTNACYDPNLQSCINSTSTIQCINSCNSTCYNPQTQYCATGNNTVFCLSNPSSVNCLRNTTIITSYTSTSVASTTTTTTTKVTTSTTKATTKITTTTTTAAPTSCCPAKNCTTNADCCQSSFVECQCFRHIQTDVYGSCLNPSVSPACGTSCLFQGKCKADGDCCKCQCATMTFTNPDGTKVAKKQCAQR